ncbi:RNA-binding domain-containing protein [Vibrio ouci]|uniref:AAA family ATPase n=1 Tax=Vibrio ouci TaxID=2499078 RepID=A0A4Y8WCW4_9VIBR|nr:RNA-binding domain-containing protein [Vibrio ouci]TFH90091.1 AAA family ATPase [Vibrio ouci]
MGVIDDWQELIAELRESSEIECKRAKSDLPKDFWETYSAFANTYGGTVFLGLTELEDGSFEVSGVKDTDKIKKSLFAKLGNPQSVSVNLLEGDGDKYVEILNIDDKDVVKITIPKANRLQKPVYINNNPKLGTYIRHHEGDNRATDSALQRMWAERGTEPRDSLVLVDFGMDDLDMSTLKKYRRNFQTRQPEHPFNDLDDKNFLIRLGGWKRNRTTKEEGLTLAGLLMFGMDISIKDHLSHYHLDYIEREAAERHARYTDRITLDGTWSGNLYDFYLKVFKKLTTDLKVPFRLETDQRSEISPVHEAIREALVNTLAHADFSCTKPITIVKRPDMFGFRNPGLMRIPPEVAILGGESDCRNNAIHDLFRMVGLSERLGSGVNKIFSNWNNQHWQKPKLYEKTEPEQTLLELRMVNLVPTEIINQLQARFGDKFTQLPELDRMILITAAAERWVNHERIMQLTDEHTRAVTVALPRLERSGMLESTGAHKEKFYTLPGVKVSTVDEVFKQGAVNDDDLNPLRATSSGYLNTSSDGFLISSDDLAASSYDLSVSSYDLSVSSDDLSSSSDDLPSSSDDLGVCSKSPELEETKCNKRDMFGRLLIDGLEYPFIDDVSKLTDDFRKRLECMAGPSREKGKLPRADMIRIITSVCTDHYVSLNSIAAIVNRKTDNLRQQYLTKMRREKLLEYAFPQQPTHEKQGYVSIKPKD